LDAFSFLVKLFSLTARVGAIFVLAGLIFYAGYQVKIEFFTGLDPLLFQAVIVAGIIGGCTVVVELAISTGRAVAGQWLPSYVQRRSSKRIALKNMDALTLEYADVLRFLKSHNIRRFPARESNSLLYSMKQACLLKIDDPNWSAYSTITYYAVPDCVWRVIDERLKTHPVPALPPWNEPLNFAGY
jgi:hypothetical protein